MSVALIELHTVMYVPLIVHVLYSVLSILSIVLYLIKSAWAVVHVRCLDHTCISVQAVVRIRFVNRNIYSRSAEQRVADYVKSYTTRA